MTVDFTEQRTNPRESEMQGILSARGSQGLRRGTAGLTWHWQPFFLIVTEGHSGSRSLSSHARNEGYICRGSWSCHPNQSLALTPDSHSIKQLWASSLWACCLPIRTATPTKGQAPSCPLVTSTSRTPLAGLQFCPVCSAGFSGAARVLRTGSSQTEKGRDSEGRHSAGPLSAQAWGPEFRSQHPGGLPR